MRNHDAELIMTRCDALAAFTEEPGRITRSFGTAALHAARETVAGWMRAAGMRTSYDALGNLSGRYEGMSPQSQTLLLGSHLDTVANAGRYDGMLGIITAIAAVQRLHDAQQRLPFAIEVVAFMEEEGFRFRTSYMGSRAFFGRFDPAWLTLSDATGITLDDAIRNWGGKPELLNIQSRATDDLLGYLEIHIEQGPVLEALNVPVGIVSAIAGQTRATLRFEGTAGHAGTVPMALRHDALTGAAEFVLAVERLGKQTTGLVATVGQLRVEPDVANVVPGAAFVSLDVRHQDDAVRLHTVEQLQQIAQQIAQQRGLNLHWTPVANERATLCDARIQHLLIDAVGQLHDVAPLTLTSGAGHDGVAVSAVAPVAMLFVRCKGGISHNPAESVTVDDVAVALDVLSGCISKLAEEL